MLDLSEHARARAWREAQGLSRPQLAKLTGYHLDSIRRFELGVYPRGGPISRNAMLTYKLACAAVAAGVSFDWGPVVIKLGE